jgi:hypothetical protein
MDRRAGMRRKFLFVAMAVGAALVPTPVNPPAYADAETDALFVSVLDRAGIPYTSVKDAITVGHRVCTSLAAGKSVEEVALAISEESGVAEYECGYFAGAAIGSYCPDEAPEEWEG